MRQNFLLQYSKCVSVCEFGRRLGRRLGQVSVSVWVGVWRRCLVGVVAMFFGESASVVAMESYFFVDEEHDEISENFDFAEYLTLAMREYPQTGPHISRSMTKRHICALRAAR